MPDNLLSLTAIGDVKVERDDPPSLFALSMSALKQGDIRFCQLEEVLSERGCAQVAHPMPLRVHPRNVSALTAVGFDVISLAGNHCMDFGDVALIDTIDLLKKNSIAPVGAGKDIDEARQRVLLEKKGIRVAFLAYNSILPPGFWADASKAGCAPLRVFTHYEHADIGQPGTMPFVHTFPDPNDLKALLEDVRGAKVAADIVIVSMHWGIHFTPAVLAQYQRDVGHMIIDAGADLLLGHHAHIAKGIEVYKSKVIFYSMGNFAFDSRVHQDALAKPNPYMKALRELYKGSWTFDPNCPNYAFAPDSRKTFIVKALISKKRVERVSFIPAYVNTEAQPEVVTSKHKRFQEILEYMQWVTREAELNAILRAEGDEVLVTS